MKRLAIALIVIFGLSPVPAEPQELTWEQINTSGFGYSNTRASGLAVFAGSLYAGTINQSPGAQVWRYASGTVWTQVNQDGFGGSNTAVQGITVFDNELYVGTTNWGAGCQVWRYDSGTTWTQLNVSGFGQGKDAGVARVLIEFNGELYAGVRNDTGGEEPVNMAGAQVWRYDSGTSWTQVNQDGFGNVPSGYNRSIESMAVLDGKLYAGTWNDDDGCQVWRFDSGTAWTQVNVNGFGKGPFVGLSVALSMEVFDGSLYVGSRNDDDGAEVWRYDGGTNWTQVNQDGFGGSSSKAIWDLTEYNNSLYAGTMTGGQVWRYDGGTAWTQVNVNGFGDATNSMVTSMTVLGGKLCAGTHNTTNYCQIWSTGNAPTPASLILDSGDYDGDSTSDIGIFRESSGLWAVRGLTRVYFGASGDIPASGDYDGDGTTDIAVFRGSSGLWAARGVTRLYYGAASDIPAPGDYDGDGTCDAAIFRGSSGLWAARGVTRTYFGTVGDMPVPLYGSGRAFAKDIGIFRPDTGLWAIRGITRVYFGTSSDQPVTGNYTSSSDHFDIGIFRESTGLWAIRGITRAYYGGGDDRPVPGNYNGFIPDGIGIFWDSTGLWAIQGITRTYFGASSDLPVSGPAINPSSAATP